MKSERNLNSTVDPLHRLWSQAFPHENTVSDKTAWIQKIKHQRIEKPVIYIGTGTCGMGAGAGKTLKRISQYLSENNVEATIIEVGCIGLCVEEPIVDIQLPGKSRVSFGGITENRVVQLLDQVLTQQTPEESIIGQIHIEGTTPWPNIPYLDEHPFFAPQTRWVLENCGIISPENIEEYVAHQGYQALALTLSQCTPAEVCDLIKQSGLRGRGGGGFLTGTKWKMALDTPSSQRFMICNADEGDPGAFMDRAVIEGDPHRVLEGLAIAAYAIQASKAYIYIRAEYPLAIKRLEQAIIQAEQAGFIGKNCFQSEFDLKIVIKKGAGAFVCGEETALMHSIEGKRGMPRPRPPYPSVSGLFDQPTAIDNVETLANVPSIIIHGAEWFRSVGTETSKGTKVFALSGKIRRTGLVEVAMGMPLRKIIQDIGGGIPEDKPFKAVQIGGPSGGCIPQQHLDIAIDYESLQTVGAMMGSGGLVVMDSSSCMVDIAKFFMQFIQNESCGKCIPCREGTRRMLEILERITRNRKNENGIEALERFKGILYLNRLAEVIKDTSLCGLGKSAPNPVLSTLHWFRDEYEAHIYERTCPAGTCKELLSYTIDTEKCKGCTLCVKQCPADAIVGTAKSPHYIIQEKCINCGNCVDLCKFNAITAK